MEKLIQLALGVVLAVLFVTFAKTRGHRREMAIYGIGLIVASLLYVVFSLQGASLQWLMIEAMGVILFALVAVLGLRVSAWFLALGWTAHVTWDVFLHLVTQQAFVPAWYPVLCIGFDFTVAGTIAVNRWKKV